MKDILDHGSRETLQTAQLLLGLSLICVGCRNGSIGILLTCVKLLVNGEKQESEHEKTAFVREIAAYAIFNIPMFISTDQGYEQATVLPRWNLGT